VVMCPVCTEMQLAYFKGPKRTSCYYCGARWIQEGAEQVGIIGLSPSSGSRSMKRSDPTTEETR
jgi:hypothetical protein